SVAMTVFGEVEVSTLREIPAGRSGVRTHLVAAGQEKRLRRTCTLIAERVAAGPRASVVAPRILATPPQADGGAPVALGGSARAWSRPDSPPPRPRTTAVLRWISMVRPVTAHLGRRVRRASRTPSPPSARSPR